jgi:GTP:adenosylcobinamide-phosphate guanylyltransferase
VALAAGVSHKALAPVGGVAMIARVLGVLAAHPELGRILVSIEEPAVLERVAELRPLLESGRVTALRSAPSPSASVLACLEGLGEKAPLLVTTGDHALLTSAMVSGFLGAARSTQTEKADFVAGVVTERCFVARFPDARRTFIPLRGERVTGANLFLLRTPAAERVVAFWRRAERFRKQPWRLFAAFGPLSLALFFLRRLDLEAALERASAAFGARAAAVRLPCAESAIDVDSPRDLELAERILAARGSQEKAIG